MTITIQYEHKSLPVARTLLVTLHPGCSHYHLGNHVTLATIRIYLVVSYEMLCFDEFPPKTSFNLNREKEGPSCTLPSW